MSVEPFSMDIENGVVKIVFASGTLVTPELVIKVIEQEKDSYDLTRVNAVWDFRGCAPSDNFGYDAMERIVHFITNQQQVQWNPRVAFVVEAGVGYGLSRMYQILVDKFPTDIGIFDALTDALKWANDTEGSAIQGEEELNA